MTSRERKYHLNKRLQKLVWVEITRVIDEDILNQLNGGEPNPDINPFEGREIKREDYDNWITIEDKNK